VRIHWQAPVRRVCQALVVPVAAGCNGPSSCHATRTGCLPQAGPADLAPVPAVAHTLPYWAERAPSSFEFPSFTVPSPYHSQINFL
jgi:hypothetical protein